MKYLILGGGGVFGMHLAKWLMGDRQNSVIAVGRNPMPSKQWTLGLEDDPRYRFEQIHVYHEPERLFRLLESEKPDVIVNFAALAYATSWEDSALYYQTNVVALARLTEWLTGKPWLHRFIQIGTSELYGASHEPALETTALKPTSPYAVSKAAADMHIQSLKAFPSIILRPSNCFAEAQQLYRIVPRAAWAAATGHKVPLNGGGVARKSYMHAEDLSRAIVTLVNDGQTGEIYNAGPDEPISIRALVEAVAQYSNLSPDELIELAPERANEDAVYWVNSDRIRDLGWCPMVSLEGGIRRVQRWVNEFLPVLGEPKPFVLRA